MSASRFRQKSIELAIQIYPNIVGDDLTEKAEQIHKYISDNNYQNIVALNLLNADIISFSETLQYDGKPVQLFEYQRNLLESWQSGNETLVIHAKDMGIKLLLSVYALWNACYGDKIRLGYVGVSPAIIKENIDLIEELHRSSSCVLPKIARRILIDRYSLKFDNGNLVQFLNPTTYISGVALTHLLVEDAGDISLSDADTIYSMFLQTREQVIMTGMPRSNMGIFYDLASSSTWFNKQQVRLSFSENPLYDSAWEAKKRLELGPKEFGYQYECQFNHYI